MRRRTGRETPPAMPARGQLRARTPPPSISRTPVSPRQPISPATVPPPVAAVLSPASPPTPDPDMMDMSQSRVPPAASRVPGRRTAPPTVGARTPAPTSGRMLVGVRLRPNDSDGPECLVADEEQRTVSLTRTARRGGGTDAPSSHSFDAVFTGGQEAVYRQFAQPMIDEAFGGYHVCLFAYGQTGSGKTYTLQGMPGAGIVSGVGWKPEDSGIVPRFLADLFERKEERLKKDLSLQIRIRMSCAEVYNEEVRDLLSGTDENLPLMEDPETKQVSVQGLTVAQVDSDAQALELLRIGNAARETAPTGVNKCSSRSHMIVQLHLTQLQQGGEDGLEACIKFVDLAGSENVGRSGTDQGVRKQEASCINKSLLTLGKAFAAFASGCVQSGMRGMLRESKLTRLLGESFLGNSITRMLAMLSTRADNEMQAQSTLQFANNAQRIKLHATRNEIRERTKDIAEMRRKLQAMERELGIAQSCAADAEERASAREEELETALFRVHSLEQERDAADALLARERAERASERAESEQAAAEAQTEHERVVRELEERAAADVAELQRAAAEMQARLDAADEERAKQGRLLKAAVERAEAAEATTRAERRAAAAIERAALEHSAKAPETPIRGPRGKGFQSPAARTPMTRTPGKSPPPTARGIVPPPCTAANRSRSVPNGVMSPAAGRRQVHADPGHGARKAVKTPRRVSTLESASFLRCFDSLHKRKEQRITQELKASGQREALLETDKEREAGRREVSEQLRRDAVIGAHNLEALVARTQRALREEQAKNARLEKLLQKEWGRRQGAQQKQGMYRQPDGSVMMRIPQSDDAAAEQVAAVRVAEDDCADRATQSDITEPDAFDAFAQSFSSSDV
eukprot:TRINITY_DN3004_c3_g1_i1.p1 TRINITY_DN3004_c3_g1~~TRINITY_DN3004_c3_g1_i1.p1  ORF type:complete len:884 (+),score=265.92 TRINITY_DN3004_c3_g1_i1:59-2653(+)